MPQSSFTLMLIFCHGTTTLLTWFICINDSAASMSNLKMCSDSKPHTLEQEALVPKFLDVHHVCVKTFCETPYLIRCDYFLYERWGIFTWIQWIYGFMYKLNSPVCNLLILEWLTFAFLNIGCGYPCSHILKVTNELTLDMIKVQHRKLYASHYNIWIHLLYEFN